MLLSYYLKSSLVVLLNLELNYFMPMCSFLPNTVARFTILIDLVHDISLDMVTVYLLDLSLDISNYCFHYLHFIIASYHFLDYSNRLNSSLLSS